MEKSGAIDSEMNIQMCTNTKKAYTGRVVVYEGAELRIQISLSVPMHQGEMWSHDHEDGQAQKHVQAGGGVTLEDQSTDEGDHDEHTGHSPH